MSTTTAKFGGTSIADAAHFRKIGEIVAKDPARRFLVVSAPGKRNPSDLKVTDLLLSVYEKGTRSLMTGSHVQYCFIQFP